MSEVIDPPEYYFPNINFNPAFYANEATGFTEAQANTLYLRKTVPDTATALETFNAGINVNSASAFSSSVSVTGATSDLIVADNATVPTKYITLSTSGVAPTISITDTSNSLDLSPTGIEPVTGAPTKTLNIATTSNVDLNVGTGTRNGAGSFIDPYIIHNYSDGDNCTAGNGVHLNNGTNNNSNTNIHNGQTSGGNVNIMTGTSSTGTVNVGIAGTTTNVKGIVNINGVGSTNTQLITIGNSTPTGITTLASPTTNITKIVSNRIDSVAVSDNMAIGGNNTTGEIQIGCAQTSGDIAIGNNAARTGTVKIGATGSITLGDSMTTGTITCLDTGSATLDVNGAGIKTNNITSTQTNGALTIGTNQTSGGTIGIGSSSSTTTLAGTVSLPSTYARLNVIQTFNAVQSFTGTLWGLACSRIKGITGQTTLSLFDEQTASDITIGLASTITLDGTVKTNTIEPTTPATSITIGNTTTLGMNIATGALSATGFVSIASSASNNSASYMNLGSDSLGYTYFRSRNIDINGNGAGNTSIGSTSGTGTITLYKPITVGYGLPTLSNQIGGSSFSESRFVYTIGTVFKAYAPINGLTAGRYIFKVYVFLGIQSIVTNLEVQFVRSNSAIANDQSTGLTTIYGGNEIYTQTFGSAYNQNVNAYFTYDVPVAPNNNVALGIVAGATLTGTQVMSLSYIRIG